MKINYLRPRVERILREDLRSRDDDAWLIFRVWQESQEDGETISLEVYDLIKKFFPDSITRIRRALQKDGLYVASESKQKERKAGQVYMTEELSSPNPYYPVWKTKEGNEVALKDMSVEHIKNCLTYLESCGWLTASEKATIDKWELLFNQEIYKRSVLF